MENYKPNSARFKAGRQGADHGNKVEKVISGTAVTKKKSDINKFADNFLSEDVSNVKNYIIMDVLIPAAKKAVSDIITNGIAMLLYGGRGNNRSSTQGSKVSYVNYYNRENGRGSVVPERAARGYSYDDIILPTRGDAEEVLSQMCELTSLYGSVSVADLYDLVGVTGNYTDNKYGWTDVSHVRPVLVRDGYLLKLPKALPLD
jgi:hypothetical protein